MFNILHTVRKGSGASPTASMSYSRNKTKHSEGKDRTPKLIIAVPVRHVPDLKFVEGQRYTLLLGDGEDAGFALIVPTGDGGGSCRIFKATLVFWFGFVPMLGDEAFAKESVEASPADVNGGILIRLPQAFSPCEEWRRNAKAEKIAAKSVAKRW
jgi:hypothetical protein